MPRLSAGARTVPQSGIRRVYQLSLTLPDVVQLSIGEPDTPVAEHVRRAAADAWTRDVTDYSPNSGIPELRAAISEKLARDNGYDAGEERIHITAGGAQALHMAMTMTLDPGDEILVPDPGYATFGMTASLLGATPVTYPLKSENGFLPTAADLEARLTPRTAAILVNSPSNPLGVVFPRATVQEVLEFAERHDLWVISDEVYEYLTYGAEAVSPAALDEGDRVFAVYSLSKTYALTGARVGYLVAPKGLGERFDAAQEATVSCVNLPAQYAALAAITGPQTEVESAIARYRENAAAATAILDEKGIRFQRPGGALYLWIDMSHVSGGDVAAWAVSLLLEEHVAVAPGSAFGPSGEGWIRICYAVDRDQLLEGVRRLPAPVSA